MSAIKRLRFFILTPYRGGTGQKRETIVRGTKGDGRMIAPVPSLREAHFAKPHKPPHIGCGAEL